MDLLPNLSKDAKIGVDQLMAKVTHSMESHQGSWYFLLVNQLRYLGYQNARVCKDHSEWKDLDFLIIDHGMNYKGAFNVFGGCGDPLVDRLEAFANSLSPLKMACHGIPMPDIGGFIRTRKKSACERFKKLDDIMFHRLSYEITTFPRIFENDKLVLGDSHSVAYYKEGYMIDRHDGLTLNGALSRGLHNLLLGFPHPRQSLVLCLGNIDVRHHLVRLGVSDTKELVGKLESQLMALRVPDIEVIGPLFIEREERVIPKPGWYKGRPFWGTWHERNAIRMNLNARLREMCERNKWSFHDCPWQFANEMAELKFDVMEARRGVHLSPKVYRWKR